MTSNKHTMIWGAAPSTTCLKLWEYISEVENQKILVFGIGDGRNAKFLASQGFEIVALDTDADLVENLKNWAKSEGRKLAAYVGDASQLDIGGPYDVILSVGMFNKIPPSQRDILFAQLLERTKPFGHVAVSVFVDKHFIDSNTKNDSKTNFCSGQLMGYFHQSYICWTNQELYKNESDELYCVDRIIVRNIPQGHKMDPKEIGQLVSLV
jgi:cyclopropane fatty-acyl-phospholipid synthase-like methyltransferase